MPRPKKWRKVCFLPEDNLFGPLTRGMREIVVMTVEEYESVRLIDWEGLQQEECAQRMNVARTTAQRIYNDAKRKIADALVNGKTLRIEGGDYKLCDDSAPPFGCGRCPKRGEPQVCSPGASEVEKKL